MYGNGIITVVALQLLKGWFSSTKFFLLNKIILIFTGHPPKFLSAGESMDKVLVQISVIPNAGLGVFNNSLITFNVG